MAESFDIKRVAPFEPRLEPWDGAPRRSTRRRQSPPRPPFFGVDSTPNAIEYEAHLARQIGGRS